MKDVDFRTYEEFERFRNVVHKELTRKIRGRITFDEFDSLFVRIRKGNIIFNQDIVVPADLYDKPKIVANRLITDYYNHVMNYFFKKEKADVKIICEDHDSLANVLYAKLISRLNANVMIDETDTMTVWLRDDKYRFVTDINYSFAFDSDPELLVNYILIDYHNSIMKNFFKKDYCYNFESEGIILC